MRLGVLSLVANESFVKDAVKEGSLSMRIKYPLIDANEATTLAKQLSVLVGFNAQQPITTSELMSPNNRLKSLMGESDYLAMAALALGSINATQKLMPFIKYLKDSPLAYKEKAVLKNPKLLTPIAFEFLYRAVGNYTPGFKQIETMMGPVAVYMHTQPGVAKADLYAALNKEAGLNAYSDVKDIEALLPYCTVFNNAWKKCQFN